eukprot:COSAG04_NODE_15969_length_514_cov_0.392771_2_plen_103_part_00
MAAQKSRFSAPVIGVTTTPSRFESKTPNAADKTPVAASIVRADAQSVATHGPRRLKNRCVGSTSSQLSPQKAVLAAAAVLACAKRISFLNFPYVYPEPVLVK